MYLRKAHKKAAQKAVHQMNRHVINSALENDARKISGRLNIDSASYRDEKKQHLDGAAGAGRDYTKAINSISYEDLETGISEYYAERAELEDPSLCDSLEQDKAEFEQDMDEFLQEHDI